MRRRRCATRAYTYRGRTYRRRTQNGRAGRALLLLLLLAGCIVVLDFSLRPIVLDVTTNEARIASVDTINQVVLEQMQEQQLEYSDLVTLEKSSSGDVLAITTNMVKMNRLKADIVSRVQKKLGGYNHKDMSIPLGTLFGSELAHGRGPGVPLRLTLSGNVTAEYKSSFVSAGINQTRHQIILEIHTSIYSFIPGFDGTVDVSTDVPVAETVIVGDVPQFMASWGNQSGAQSASENGA